MYYYSNMIASWSLPPDTLQIMNTMNNLSMWCTIYNIKNQNKDTLQLSNVYWSNMPSFINTNDFYNWSTSVEMGTRYNVEFDNIVYFGGIGEYHTTAIETDNFIYFIVIDYQAPSNINTFLFISSLIIIFMLILYFFIRKYLYPVKLLKKRIRDLKGGDLDSEVKIISKDELAELSISINQMIKNIRQLLNQKQALLLDVSHELRSPLTRMQLLLENM